MDAAKKTKTKPPMPAVYFREWRESIGLSCETLGERMGVAGVTVWRHETAGEREGVTFEYLVKFAEAVGCPNVFDPLIGPPGMLPVVINLLTRMKPETLEHIHRLAEVLQNPPSTK
jgi:hypothetical protein